MDLLSLVLIGNTEDFDPVTLSFYECLGNLLQPQKKNATPQSDKLPVLI